MANPRDVEIDIVARDKTSVGTRSAERNLDRVDRKVKDVDKSSTKAGRALEKFAGKLGQVKANVISNITDKLKAMAGMLGKLAAGASVALPALGALQPVIIGLTTALAPAAAALGVFGAVAKSVFGDINDASSKNSDLVDRIRLLKETAKVQRARGDKEGADKTMKAAAKASAELQARYNLLDPTIRKGVESLDRLKSSWQDFIDKNTPRTVELLAKAFELLNRQIPKLQPLFEAGANAVEDFLGFIERKINDGTVDRFITFLSEKAPEGLRQTGNALKDGWEAAKTAWQWWTTLSDGVMTAVTAIKGWVLSMKLSWFQTLESMYKDSATFLRNAAEAFGKLPGVGAKVRQALTEAANGLDASAYVARQKAQQIQADIDKLHGKTVDVVVNTHYKVYGTPAGTKIPSWYGKAPGGDAYGGFTGSAVPDFTFAGGEAGMWRSMPAAQVTAPAVNNNVYVTVDGTPLKAMVRSEVGRAIGNAAGRARFGRTYA